MKTLALLAMLGAPLSTGCVTTTVASHTKMALGESYAPGEPKFDAFFEEVIDARTKSADLDGEAPLRKTLAEGLGVATNAAADQVLASAKEKADAVKASGGALYVQVVPEAKVYNRDLKEKDRTGPLLKAVEDTVKQGMEKADELSGMGGQIRVTEAKIDDLKREAETAFPDPKKRAEVLLELDASREVLEKARVRAFAESGRALGFVVSVVRAVDTGGADMVASADSSPKPKPGAKPAGRPVGKPGPPGAKPPGKKPKEDFDP